MEGWHGWDEYAPFYDWENARTMARRDVPFWQQLARRLGGRVLELGCGTGRVSVPVARAAGSFVGIDRSAEMLRRSRARFGRAKLDGRARLVRGDIRKLPFSSRAPFQLVMAPYGILQSLLREVDLTAALASVARVTTQGGTVGVDLVPDLPRWPEYQRQIILRGRRSARGSHLTLVESVRQDRSRRLTVFDQEYVERRGSERTVRRFSLTFRTLSVPQMTRRLERAGFRVDAMLGDYNGAAWHRDADVWVILASKR